jgi:hypothetical protein
MRIPLVLAAIASAGAFVACASLSGADALFVDESDSGFEAGADVAAIVDGGPSVDEDSGEADPPLLPCEAGVCIPTNDGWIPALRKSSGFGGGSSECPASWPQATVYDTPDSFVCSCKCTRNGSACEGTVSLAQGPFPCTGTPVSFPNIPSDGGCVATTLTGLTTGSVKATMTTTSTPSSCTGAPTPTGGGFRDMRVCSGATPLKDATCGEAAVCVPPSPEERDALCVMHDGDVACPKGFSDRREIGLDGTDGRGCSACTCDVDCNSDGSFEGFVNANCTGSLGKLALGQCGAGGIPNAAGVRFTAGSGCKVATDSNVTGEISYPQLKTLCCQRNRGGGG